LLFNLCCSFHEVLGGVYQVFDRQIDIGILVLDEEIDLPDRLVQAGQYLFQVRGSLGLIEPGFDKSSINRFTLLREQ